MRATAGLLTVAGELLETVDAVNTALEHAQQAHVPSPAWLAPAAVDAPPSYGSPAAAASAHSPHASAYPSYAPSSGPAFPAAPSSAAAPQPAYWSAAQPAAAPIAPAPIAPAPAPIASLGLPAYPAVDRRDAGPAPDAAPPAGRAGPIAQSAGARSRRLTPVQI